MTPLLASRPRTERAFERIYRRHVTDVYHYALAVLRNPADAEDVTQTTFMNAYRAFQRGERPQAPKNWLIAIAHNVCRQRFRQSTRRVDEVAYEEGTAEALVADDDAPSAEDIRRALSQLAFNQRAALVMRELEGRSYAEIAEILGVSVSAVETLLFRARRALREQLEGALSCDQAELALSKSLDGRLPRAERGARRAHLRECSACATAARRQRAQRAALKGFAAIPIPGSLESFFGGGSAGAGVAAKVAALFGTGATAKAAAVVASGVAVGAAGYTGVQRTIAADDPPRVAVAERAPRPAARVPASRVSVSDTRTRRELTRPRAQAGGEPVRRPDRRVPPARAARPKDSNGRAPVSDTETRPALTRPPDPAVVAVPRARAAGGRAAAKPTPPRRSERAEARLAARRAAKLARELERSASRLARPQPRRATPAPARERRSDADKPTERERDEKRDERAPEKEARANPLKPSSIEPLRPPELRLPATPPPPTPGGDKK